MIGWAVETLVASSVLMLVVLALRAPVRRAFGPAMAYALWAIPALRMLLPPLPETVRLTEIAPIGAAIPPGTISLGVPVATIPAVPQGWGMSDVPAIVIGLWVIGALGFVGWHLVSYIRFCRRIRAQAQGSYRVAGGRVAVVESDAAAGPMAFGIWRKHVAFPSDFAERYDEAERDLALAHELGHHARGDLIANWIALAMLGLHWFNPIAWRAFRAFRADQEMACDALVLGNRPAALRHAYGRAIVKSAHGGAVSAACHLHTINEIKGRLKMLTKHRRASRGQMAGGTAGVAALTLAALGLTASGTHAAETFRDRVEGSIGVKLDDIKLPLPPLPPIAPNAAQDAAPAASPAPPAPVDDLAIAPPQPPIQPGPGELAELRALENVPDVEERTCGAGSQHVIHEQGAGGKKRMVICTDRIEAQVEQATAMAMQHAKFAEATKATALASARASIAMARTTIENEASLSPEDRAEALAGLDEAIAEIEAEGID
ncbi:M56 family metallopeptidase [Sphingomonas japonica]|uniref:Beta-lactamase regulating signal transducer with metallopeptidase domain n=1 Tax=Sphingomonas japonica TaxID=511662 RepID=A0ABX0TZ61_9SPHN|nr:M56 family metallopeptidase [Sphingomonas japonica]NIJ23609.1 beta-lactamase regulating signal transducer with metallopeptidase domain [Sphingomonas japonica]